MTDEDNRVQYRRNFVKRKKHKTANSVRYTKERKKTKNTNQFKTVTTLSRTVQIFSNFSKKKSYPVNTDDTYA